VPEFIDLVFVKTSPKRLFSTENEHFCFVFAQTGSIISGTVHTHEKKGKEYAHNRMKEQQIERARKGLREDKWNTQERKEGITQITQERLEGKQKYYAGKEGVGINNAHRKGRRQWRENKDIMRERMK
jgi:hypothetical protein